MSDSGASETARKRRDGDRPVDWMLVGSNRLVLTAGIALGVFGLLVAFSLVAPTPMRRVVVEFDAIRWVFSALITAIITAVTLVVTFSQLVLSQELGALGDQRKRMQEASAFRDDVQPYLETPVSPPTPASFLRELLVAIGRHAKTLENTHTGPTEPSNRAVREFGRNLIADARSVERMLQGTQFGTFDVIYAALQFDYSLKIYEAERLLADQRESPDSSNADVLEDTVTLLELFGPAREHFKTLYFQWELITLSRRMLYTSVPALLVTVSMLLFIDPAGVTGTTLGLDDLVWLVCAAVTVALVPFFLLIAYVLRVTTVTKRTLAMGPFVLRNVDVPADRF